MKVQILLMFFYFKIRFYQIKFGGDQVFRTEGAKATVVNGFGPNRFTLLSPSPVGRALSLRIPSPYPSPFRSSLSSGYPLGRAYPYPYPYPVGTLPFVQLFASRLSSHVI